MKLKDFLKEQYAYEETEEPKLISFGVIERGIVNEASLSRILQHHKNDFVIISASRAIFNKEENIQRTRQLKAELDKRKLGGIPLRGHWQECQVSGVDYKDCPTEEIQDVVEYSFLVPHVKGGLTKEEFLDVISALTKKFEQDAALLKTDVGLFLLDGDGSVEEIGTGEITLNKISQGYSEFLKNNKVKGSPFVFEGVVDAATINGKRLYQIYNLEVKDIL